MRRPSLLVLALIAARHSVIAAVPTFSPFPISTSPTSTTASTSSASPSGTPTFLFSVLPATDVPTCSTNYLITWAWGAGVDLPKLGFTLSVTNINVTQGGVPAVSSSTDSTAQITHPITDLRRQIIPSVASGSVLATGSVSPPPGSSSSLPGLLESLTTSLDPSAQNFFTWGIVDLPQGWYRFMATATDGGDTDGGVGGIWSTFNATSDLFFIRNGTDTSCLAPILASTSSDASSTGAATSTAGQTSPTSVGSISASSHVNSGAIAGGVVGGIVAIVTVLAICLLQKQRRRRRDSRGLDGTDTDDAPKSSIGKWGALGSFDSTNGPKSATRSPSKNPDLDPVTALNTSANSRPQKSGGFGLGDMGLAALGLAKPQHPSPSAYTATPNRHRQWSKHNSSATTESAGGIMSSSFSSGDFSPSSSAHGHFDPYRAEDSSPYEKAVPMRNLSPTSSPTREDYLHYQPYISSMDTFGSGAPGADESSPFATPPPSQPASRHNSRSYSNQTFAALGPADSSSSTAIRTNRARSRSQSNSPTSTRPTVEIPNVPHSPKSHKKVPSSPDAIASALNEDQLAARSTGSRGTTKRTPRKPVPSYTPEDSPADTPVSPMYMYSGSTIAEPPKRRAPPPVPRASDSASSSSASLQKLPPVGHALEHKDSAHSLASLRRMEGDLSGYSAVLGKESGKQMHVLIPDMPLAQH